MKNYSAQNIMLSVGHMIAQLRREKGFTQENLCNQAEIGITTLRGIENEGRNCSLDILIRILGTLDISLPSFFKEVSTEYAPEDSEEEKEFNARILECMYPPRLSSFSVTTLLDFLVYLPLLEYKDIIDILLRISGDIVGYELYILQLLDKAVKAIPQSPAKDYADYLSKVIAGTPRRYAVYEDRHPFELPSNPGSSEEYILRIKKLKEHQEELSKVIHDSL